IDDSLILQPKSVTVSSTDVPTLKVDTQWKENNDKPSRRTIRYAELYRSQRPRGNQRGWNGQKTDQLGCNFVFHNKACFICGDFDHIQYNCPNAYKHMVPRAVLMKTGLKTVKNTKPLSTARSVNTVRPVSTARFVNTVRSYNTAHPKPTVSCARPKTHFQNQAQRPNVNTVRARGFNAVKPSAYWGLIMEYLVNISKRRAFWSLNKDILKINDSDNQYAVSIKEDTVYPCLHSPKTTKETSSIRRIQKMSIRRIEDIVCEYSGRYQTWSLLQETPIRRIQCLGYAVSRPTPDSINRKLKNEF
ncbi:ribonuclease H-like domain-containing protein, partial [Tanacetum coccineum]